MSISLKQTADPMVAAVSSQDLNDVLKERGIVVFFQNNSFSPYYVY